MAEFRGSLEFTSKVLMWILKVCGVQADAFLSKEREPCEFSLCISRYASNPIMALSIMTVTSNIFCLRLFILFDVLHSYCEVDLSPPVWVAIGSGVFQWSYAVVLGCVFCEGEKFLIKVGQCRAVA